MSAKRRERGRIRVLVVYGTRPEAIKMAPVVAALRARGERFEPAQGVGHLRRADDPPAAGRGTV